MEQGDDKRKLIIGGPLLLVTVLCFGFFLVRSNDNGVDHSTVSEPANHKKVSAVPSPSINQLPSLPATKNTPATSSPAVDAESPSTANVQVTATAKHDGNNKTGNMPATTPDDESHNGLIQTVVNGLLNGH